MMYVLIFIGFVAVCFVFGQMVKNKPIELNNNSSLEDIGERQYLLTTTPENSIRGFSTED
jgi:NADH:ubiquinone oxidoreductase subunit 6 (subunit J)